MNLQQSVVLANLMATGAKVQAGGPGSGPKPGWERRLKILPS